MTRPVFRAKVDAGGRGRIAIDDHDISDLVTAFVVEMGVDRVSKVVLTLIATELDLEIETDATEGYPSLGEKNDQEES